MPSLDEIREMVMKSNLEEDWHTIGCWGGGSGPSFLDQFAQVNQYVDGEPIASIEHDAHGLIGVYRPAVELRVAYGLDIDDRAQLHFDGLHFADESVTGKIIDFFWNGALVDRVHTISVDGGRAVLPRPSGREDEVEEAPGLYTVTGWEYSAARLAHSLERVPDSFDQYFDQAGFKVI